MCHRFDSSGSVHEYQGRGEGNLRSTFSVFHSGEVPRIMVVAVFDCHNVFCEFVGRMWGFTVGCL